MGYKIQGNVAIVTGGSQGFGREFTNLLLKKGAKVAFSDINEEVGRKTESDFQKDFGKENVIFIRADVTKDEDWTSLWDETEQKLGAVAILVNNAGIGASLGWERNVDIMLKGVGKGTFLALERMGKNMSGRIINISSIAGIASGFTSDISISGYTMAKHGVIGLTRSFPRARPTPFSKYGVKAYALCPWFADTQLLRNEISDLAKLERATKTRVLTAQEVGQAMITALDKDKDGACYLIYPDVPLIDFPNCNENLFACSVVAGWILKKVGYEPDIIGWPVVLAVGALLLMLLYYIMVFLMYLVW